MSTELFFDPNSSPVVGIVTAYPVPVDVPSGAQNALLNPDLSQVAGIAQTYWKVANRVVVPMTGPEKVAYDAAIATALTSSQRSSAQIIIQSASDQGKVLRAEADVLLSEINILREWIASFKTAVAAATTLANLKTGVAALPDMPDRTLAQAKTAILNEISAGTVD